MSQNSPSPQQLAKIKTRIAAWLDATGTSGNDRKAVLNGVRRLSEELPRRGDWFEVITVGLRSPEHVSLRLIDRHLRTEPTRDMLIVSTIVPGWGFGWHNIWKDEHVYDTLSWLMHYARQYIHRSYVASVLMAAWEAQSVVLHPFGHTSSYRRYNTERKIPSAEEALRQATLQFVIDEGETPSEGASLSDTPWLTRNTLDPLVHQAIFHFLRAQQLLQGGFEMEAVVAFDCTAQCCAKLVRRGSTGSQEPTRADTARLLGGTRDQAEHLEFAYFLRNNFGAHAGGWRWWDQGDLLSDDALSDIASATSAVLGASAEFEKSHRLVEPAPSSWPDWFFQNFELIWDATSFETFDRWSAQRAEQSESDE